MSTFMKHSAIALIFPFAVLAQFQPPPAGFEDPPTLNSAEILLPQFASGPGFTVRPPVPTYGGRNGYMIDSEFGVFEADGNSMLMRRVYEIGAIQRLREVSRTDEYKNALVAAAKSPLLVAKGLIEHPAKTITGVPKGLWKSLNRLGQGVKEAAQKRERSEYEDSSAEELIGFSKAKRALALDLGVDPYSSNEALQRELNGIAWTAYAGKATFQLATLPVGGGAGAALTATNVTGGFNASLRDKSPTDLRLGNLKALLAMGCNRATADSFLANPAFSPSAQTAIVMHLGSMEGVKGRSKFVQLADDSSTGEGDAMFYVETSRILTLLNAGGTPLASLEVLDQLPVAITRDGRAVVGLEWDYAAWTQNASDFLALLKESSFGKSKPRGVIVALSGDASPMVQEKTAALGVELKSRLSPGPLK
jgi:hypothetical protein